MKKKSFAKGYLIGLIIGIVAGYQILIKASTTPELRLENFAFVDLQGHPIELDRLKGKAVVVNIWATWCPPCIKEMPSIENAERDLRNDNVVFLVASDETTEKITRFKEKRKFNLPFCSFSLKDNATSIGEGRPQTYIFDKRGNLVYNRLGAFEWDDDKILSRLRSYLR